MKRFGVSHERQPTAARLPESSETLAAMSKPLEDDTAQDTNWPNSGGTRSQGLRIWVVTDGKAGDEIPCLGVAEELLGIRNDPIGEVGSPPMDPRLRYPSPLVLNSPLTGTIEIRRVAPRPPWVWFMPRGPIDPREKHDQPGSPIAPPWPDILIASGRRSIAYVRTIKRLAGSATFAVILKDPRTSTHGADFVWVPEHDRSKNPSFMRTLTTPHRFSASRIAAVRNNLLLAITRLPGPRIGLLLGGRTRLGPFSQDDTDRLCQSLQPLKQSAGSFLITVSRRTPPELLKAVKAAIGDTPCFIWDKNGPNPYLHILAGADAIVVTGDSHTMISEASSTGVPVLIFEPHCIKQKLTYFGLRMMEEGWARGINTQLTELHSEPHDCTTLVANAIRNTFERQTRTNSGFVGVTRTAS